MVFFSQNVHLGRLNLTCVLLADPDRYLSTKCSSETDMGSADPPKTASRGSANPQDDSSSSRCSPTKVRVDGVLVDVEGFSHPRRSNPSSRPQVPPKPVASDRLKKAEQNLVLSNQFSALSDDEMDSSSISPD